MHMNKLIIAVIAGLATGCATNAQHKDVEYKDVEVRSCYYDESGEEMFPGLAWADFFTEGHPSKNVVLSEDQLPTKAQWYHRPKAEPTKVAGIEFKINEVGNTRDSGSAEEWVGPEQRGDGERYLNNLISTGTLGGAKETYEEWYDREVAERQYRVWQAEETMKNRDATNWHCKTEIRKHPNTPIEMPKEWLDQWPKEQTE